MRPVNPIRAFASSHTTKGVRKAILHVRDEWTICRRHRSNLKLVPGFVGTLPIKLHLGSGPNYKPGWINIDLFHPEADLQLDLRETWPFPSESASHIYSEHVFEHFDYYDEIPHFLKESMRILRQDGIFDVGVPDTEWPLRAYQHPEDEYWQIVRKWHPAECATPLDHINYHFRQHGEHKYAWDWETLKASVESHGFVTVERREFDPALDCASRNPGTLYLRAQKN
jgi:predicted SAM-dependent methyltransferase